MSKNLNKNKEVSLPFYLISDLDPGFFESLIDNLGNANNILLTQNSALTIYLENIIFLNILPTEILSNKLDWKLTEEKTEGNLIYAITKPLNNSKVFDEDIKHQREKFFFHNLKSAKHNSLLSSETSNLIKHLKNYILI